METARNKPSGGPGSSWSDGVKDIAVWPVRAVMGLIDVPMRFFQRVFGIGGMPYLFVAPNLLFFGVFVVIPLFISFAYSVTGGTGLFLENRPFVGGQQYGYLLDCGNALDPSTCREDRFWRGIYNTITFVTFQVGFMVLFSLITALVLNRKIKARGFFRSVYFFLSCCPRWWSP